jgi:hypothetical protein
MGKHKDHKGSAKVSPKKDLAPERPIGKHQGYGGLIGNINANGGLCVRLKRNNNGAEELSAKRSRN